MVGGAVGQAVERTVVVGWGGVQADWSNGGKELQAQWGDKVCREVWCVGLSYSLSAVCLAEKVCV